MKKVLLTIAFVYVFSFIFAQIEYVTDENYKKIKMGMTYNEIVEVVEMEGVLDTTVIYIWPDENLKVEWKGGKMNSFGSADTMQKEGCVSGYDAVKKIAFDENNPTQIKNLSYDDIVELIGKEGKKPETVRYLWRTSKNKIIKVVFKDGKVNEIMKW